MPTVFSYGPFRVLIYSNDHAPAHVHVLRKGSDGDHAKIELGSDPGEVRIVVAAGAFRRSARLAREALEQVRMHHGECLRIWNAIHAGR